MSKEGRKIKPAYSLNLETLIDEVRIDGKKITKKQLAKLINTSPQTISKACNGIRLTKETAESIVNLFPDYNIGWLLGYSNLKYKNDVGKMYLEQALVSQAARQHQEASLDTIARLANDTGFNTFFDGRIMTVEPNEDLKNQGFSPVTLTFKDKALSNLQDDVYAFIKYRFEVIIKRGR